MNRRENPIRLFFHNLQRRGGSGSFIDVLLGMAIITTLCSAATGALLYIANNPRIFRIP